MNKYGRMLLVSLMASSLIVTPAWAAPETESLESQKAAAENEADTLQQELVELLDKMGRLEEDLITKGEEIIQAEEDLKSAVIRREKLIHIGIMKISTMTDFPLSLLVARMNARGYARSRHTAVVTIAIPKL